MQTNSNIEQDTGDFKESHLLKRIFAGILDAGIFLFLYFELMVNMPSFIPYANLGLLVFFVLYRATAIFITGGTLGMTLCNSIFLTGEQERLSASEKILAALFILVNGTDYYDR